MPARLSMPESRERETWRKESFIERKQYEGKSLIKNTKVVLFI